MKKSIPYIVVLVLGVVIGWLCREHHCTSGLRQVQRDTVIRYDTVRYTPLQLHAGTYHLEVSDYGGRLDRRVYIPDDSIRVVYRDSVRYVTFPRQYYLTSIDGLQIWHSGIDSKIDSLNILAKTEKIIETHIPRKKDHCISLGVKVNHSTSFTLPIQLEYGYRVKDWLTVYGYAEYDYFMKQFSIGLGTQVQIEW